MTTQRKVYQDHNKTGFKPKRKPNTVLIFSYPNKPIPEYKSFNEANILGIARHIPNLSPVSIAIHLAKGGIINTPNYSVRLQ